MVKKKRSIAMSSESLRNKGKGIAKDATEYGEFVPSLYNWLPIEEQKKNAEYMEHLGD